MKVFGHVFGDFYALHDDDLKSLDEHFIVTPPVD